VRSSPTPDSPKSVIVSAVVADAVVDDSLSPTSPLGDAVETFLQSEDAEQFIEDVRRDEPRPIFRSRSASSGQGGGTKLTAKSRDTIVGS
jgi:hypothetical protein